MTVANAFTTDYRVYREATALVQAGIQVTLFCVHMSGLAREETIDGVQVKRVLDDYIKLPFTSRARKVRKTWLKALRAEQADLYHAHDRDTLDYSVKVARERGVPVIYDSHEFWPDKNRYQNNTGNFKDKLSTAWWNHKEKTNARRADAMIMTSPGHANKIVELFRVEQPVIVRNIPVYQRGKDRNYLKNKFGLGARDKIVFYVGNIQKNRGLAETITALNYLPDNIHFVIMGYGDYRQSLEKNIPANLSRRVHFHEPVHFFKIIPIMYGADVGIAPIQPSCFSYIQVLPNKPFEYLMAELPIAVSDFPEMRKIALQNKVGTVFDPKDPRDIARAIQQILKDPKKYQDFRRNATAVTRDKYRWDLEKEKLINLYNRLLK